MGGGFEGVTTLAPSPENFNHTLWMSFLTDNSAQATKIFRASSNIGVHQILCNNTDTEARGYLYDRKSDPEAKVIPKPSYVCKTAKLIPKWAKLILT